MSAPSDAGLNSMASRAVKALRKDTDQDVEYTTDFSWRNFFSCINRLKIIQKLLKGRTNQIHHLSKTYVRDGRPFARLFPS